MNNNLRFDRCGNFIGSTYTNGAESKNNTGCRDKMKEILERISSIANSILKKIECFFSEIKNKVQKCGQKTGQSVHRFFMTKFFKRKAKECAEVRGDDSSKKQQPEIPAGDFSLKGSAEKLPTELASEEVENENASTDEQQEKSDLDQKEETSPIPFKQQQIETAPKVVMEDSKFSWSSLEFDPPAFWGEKFQLPGKINEHIFTFLSLKDLAVACQVNKSWACFVKVHGNTRIKEHAKRVEVYIKWAELLDEKLKNYTDDQFSLIGEDFIDRQSQIEDRDGNKYKVPFFQFNGKKWLNFKNQLLAKDHITPKILCESSQKIGECRLDLVEALSEYNVEGEYLDENLEGNILEGLKESIEKEGELLSLELMEIVNKAMKTCKGNLKITGHYRCNDDFSSKWTLLESEQYPKEGPRFCTHISNIECSSWDAFYYERYPARPAKKNPNKLVNMGINIHFDLIVGKRQGERLVCPGINNKGDKQFIFRTHQIFDNTSFEQKLLCYILYYERLNQEYSEERKVNAKYFDRRKEVINTLITAYGMDEVKAAADNQDPSLFPYLKRIHLIEESKE